MSFLVDGQHCIRKGYNAVIMVTMIALSLFSSHPCRIVTYLGSSINYLCLEASNKQQINWKEVKKSTGKLKNILLSDCRLRI